MFAAESILCQFISWPFVYTDYCAWQQWAPVLVGYLAAFVFRVKGRSRLIPFVTGMLVFYVVTIISARITSLQTSGEALTRFFYACLFLFPVAGAVSLSGLICGDLWRILRKRWNRDRSRS